MKFKRVLIFGALAWVLIRATRPKWYDDLMLRAFAADQFADPGKTKENREQFEKAADVAARVALPLGWVLVLAQKVNVGQLEDAAKKVRSKVLSMGPPADTKPETLSQYKAKALGV